MLLFHAIAGGPAAQDLSRSGEREKRRTGGGPAAYPKHWPSPR